LQRCCRGRCWSDVRNAPKWHQCENAPKSGINFNFNFMEESVLKTERCVEKRDTLEKILLFKLCTWINWQDFSPKIKIPTVG
jgi:hypothetical protein